MSSANTQDSLTLSQAANFTMKSIVKSCHRPLACVLACSLIVLTASACRPKDQNAAIANNDTQPGRAQVGVRQPGDTQRHVTLTDEIQPDTRQPADTQKATVFEQQAKAIHERVITLDSHVDIPREYMLKPEFDPGKTTNLKVDLDKMDRGGLDVAFFIVYVEQ